MGWSRPGKAARVLWITTLVGAGVFSRVEAQGVVDRLFPHVRYFEPLIADPLEPRLGVSLLTTNLFQDAPHGRERLEPFTIPDPEDSRSDVTAGTAIGGTLPVWHLKQWNEQDGIVIGAQAGVLGRFRIEYPTREDVGQDWFVGMPIEIRRGEWSGRLRFMHRSSHLGDELVETTGAARVEVGGEFIDFMVAYSPVPDVRLYGGSAWIFRSYTNILPALTEQGWHDRTLVQLGVDGSTWPWMNGALGLVGGADWRRAQRTNWQDSFAAAGGFAIRTPTGSARLVARYFTGVSLLEQFFLSKETYWGLELSMDF